jgi:hypothetical protein
MTRTLVARGPVAVSPSSCSTFAPPASARKPSRATSALLSRGERRRRHRLAGIAAHPLSGRSEAPFHPSAPRRAELGQAAGPVPGVEQAPQDSHERHAVGAGVGHASTSLRQTAPAARPTRSRRWLTLTAGYAAATPARMDRAARPQRCYDLPRRPRERDLAKARSLITPAAPRARSRISALTGCCGGGMTNRPRLTHRILTFGASG